MIARELSPELWYELERIRTAWSEFRRFGTSPLENERMAQLDNLVSMGLAECWEPVNGSRRFYRITERGVGTLEKGSAKGLHKGPGPQLPPSESYWG